MPSSARFLSPSEAARRLGISSKALRVYERHGLVAPPRNATGWRAYGPEEMARAAEIVALRRLGLSLADVGRILGGDPASLEPALASHQARLEARIGELRAMIATLRDMRAGLARGKAPPPGDIAGLTRARSAQGVAFELPWPWGGEWFELRDIRPLTFIVGPLGSGKTRLARRLAEALPGSAFLGLDRGGERPQLAAEHRSRVEDTMRLLLEDGAIESHALRTLVIALEADGPAALIVDMVEQGLDHASQEALIAHLRHRGRDGRTLFLLTRSSAILDLAAVGREEAILFCPANHSPPIEVAPHPGAAGHEALATCLAPPAVRARTEGMIAWRPAHPGAPAA